MLPDWFRTTNREVRTPQQRRRASLGLKGPDRAPPTQAPQHAPVSDVCTGSGVHVLRVGGAKGSGKLGSVGGKVEGRLDVTGAIQLIHNNRDPGTGGSTGGGRVGGA